MLYRRPAIWLGAGFCRRRCFFTCLSATPCSFVRLLLHNAPFFLPTHLPFCNVPYFCPPTCLSLWERWQAERPDGEGASVGSCMAFSKYGRSLPSQSQGLQPCASSPKGRAKWVGGRSDALPKGEPRAHCVRRYAFRRCTIHLPPPMGEAAGRTA